MPNISLDTIDIINKKPAQADAISALIIAGYESDIRLNDDISASVAWTISDLIMDVKQLLKNEVKDKAQSATRGNA